MCPPIRPSARIGNSRLTWAPSRMRENEVRTQVSSARSAPKESPCRSTAVRHTPLTATLSPFLSSLATLSASMVSRRLPPVSLMLVTLPTSSMSPVNIFPPLSAFCPWIAQVAFDGEIDPEAMERKVLHLRRIVQTGEPGTAHERHRARTPQYGGRIVEENLVYDAGGERFPVYRGAAFDQHAGDLQLAKPPQHGVPVGMTSRPSWRLFNLHAAGFEFTHPLLEGFDVKDHHVLLCGLYHARSQGRTQMRIENDAQQWPASRPAGAVGEQWIVGNDGPHPDQDRVHLMAQLLHMGTRRLAGNPA